MEVVLATSNPGKAREFDDIFRGLGVTLRTAPMWLGEIETGTTYLENARLKAQSVQRLMHAPVLAEDAGLEVDALHGLPGIHSARFAGFAAKTSQNNAKLLRLLEGVEQRTARYRAVAVLSLPSGAEFVGEGTLEGSIATAPRGDGGFGYDPLFVPEGGNRTAAELSPEEKNRFSHRARALGDLLEKASLVLQS
jgi:non-canonical purine NTP pyrophosphatase (RdgB/HAM1 family)